MVLLKEARGLSDEELAATAQAGGMPAFDEIVRRYKDRVYNVVYRFLGNHEDALDIAQEAFVRAYRGIDTFQGNAKLSTWLFAIASNLARNHLRDRGRKGRNKGVSIEALEASAPDVAQAATATRETPRLLAEAAELRQGLEGCLAMLPESFRMPFVLRTFEGLSYEEIASSLECPRGTVKSRLNQARRRLGECLRKRGIIE